MRSDFLRSSAPYRRSVRYNQKNMRISILLMVILFSSCESDKEIVIQVLLKENLLPIEKARVFISRPDRSGLTHGGFELETDSTGTARIIITTQELETYPHTVLSYKENYFLTGQSKQVLDPEQEVDTITLFLSTIRGDYQRSLDNLQEGGPGLIEVESIEER